MDKLDQTIARVEEARILRTLHDLEHRFNSLKSWLKMEGNDFGPLQTKCDNFVAKEIGYNAGKLFQLREQLLDNLRTEI